MAMILVLILVFYVLWSINTLSNINNTVGRLETEIQDLNQQLDHALRHKDA